MVATPIGNLEDITLRALRVLRAVDTIAAEDTRVTLKLLSHYGIRKPLLSYHRHSPRAVVEKMLGRLREGKDVALVSDAGTPGVSDEGREVVRRCVAAGIAVAAVPGPSALLAALVVSGLPMEGFLFVGFPPRASAGRKRALRELAAHTGTLAFFEAPHRLMALLSDALEILGDRQCVVARELTKRFEEVARGSLAEVLDRFGKTPPRGEATVMIAGAPKEAPGPAPVEEALRLARRLAGEGASRRSAAQKAAESFGIPWRLVYRSLLEK